MKRPITWNPVFEPIELRFKIINELEKDKEKLADYFDVDDGFIEWARSYARTQRNRS